MDHQEATTTQAVERYLLDEMTGEQREKFEEHYFSCAECADAIRSGAVLMANGRAVAMEDLDRPGKRGRVTEMPARTGRPRAWPAWMQGVPAAAAAVLVMIVGYQNVFEIPELKHGATSPRSGVYAVVRPPSRGVPVSLRLEGAEAVMLEYELNFQPVLPNYRVEIQRQGASTMTIPNLPVKKGAITIDIPEAKAGDYEVIIRGTSDGKEADRFTLHLGD